MNADLAWRRKQERERKTISATARMEAARRMRDSRVTEVLHLVALLSQTDEWRPLMHRGRASKTTMPAMNYIVCLHSPSGNKLTWRMNDFDSLEFFSHLPLRTCDNERATRTEKMNELDVLATKASAVKRGSRLQSESGQSSDKTPPPTE